MFCPKCGNADQQPDTYCRQCGTFLPDLSKPFKKTATPEEHVKANTVLSAMTIVASFTLAILLWTTLGFRPGAHPLIYVTAGLLFAMGVWHIQTLWRILLLKKHLKSRRGPQEITAPETNAALPEADMSNVVPVSVTDRTTRELHEENLTSRNKTTPLS